MPARAPIRPSVLAATLLLPALGACTIASVPDEESSLTVAERFYQQRLQDGVDRTARVRRVGEHVLVVQIGSAALSTTRASAPAMVPAREALVRTVARNAWAGGAATDGDTVVVALGQPRRLGPLVFDGRTTRDTFVESPAPAATAAVP